MWLISLKAPKPIIDQLTDRIEPFACSVSFFEDQSAEDLWNLQITTQEEPSHHDFSALLAEVCLHPFPAFQIEKLKDKDWVAENQRSFPPLTAGPFYIYGSHITDPLPLDKICLHIEASTAFGTGQHGTTLGCLEALAALKNEGFDFNIALDVGTGTGILAMAISRLFHINVMATDNDPQAVQKARENMFLNNCIQNVTVIEDADLQSPQLLATQPFDLLIANILANTVIELAPAITKITRPGSVIILSGLLHDQVEHVLKAYTQLGYIYKETIPHKEWSTMILMRML